MAEIGEPVKIGASHSPTAAGGLSGDAAPQQLTARQTEPCRLRVDAGQVFLGHISDEHVGHVDTSDIWGYQNPDRP
jgi:hypothetical protein